MQRFLTQSKPVKILWHFQSYYFFSSPLEVPFIVLVEIRHIEPDYEGKRNAKINPQLEVWIPQECPWARYKQKGKTPLRDDLLVLPYPPWHTFSPHNTVASTVIFWDSKKLNFRLCLIRTIWFSFVTDIVSSPHTCCEPGHPKHLWYSFILFMNLFRSCTRRNPSAINLSYVVLSDPSTQLIPAPCPAPCVTSHLSHSGGDFSWNEEKHPRSESSPKLFVVSGNQT